MIKIAELKFTVVGDLRKLEAQLKALFKKQFQIEGKSSGGGGTTPAGKEQKKQTGLLGGILKGLFPLGVLMSLKPVADLFKIVSNFIILGIIKLIQWLKEPWKGLTDSLSAGFDGLKDTLDMTIGGIEDMGVWLSNFVNGPVKDFGIWMSQFVGEKVKSFGEWMNDKVVNKLVNFGNWLGAFVTGGRITHFGDWLKNNFITGGFIKNFGAWLKAIIFGEGGTGTGTTKGNTVPSTGSYKDYTDVTGYIGKVLGLSPQVVSPSTTNNSSNRTIIFNGVTPQEMLNQLKSELYTDTTLSSRY